MKRILIIGGCGAGKPTFSLKLGSLLNLPVIHLDKEFWNPGWVETEESKWREKVKALVSGPKWIIEGNYHATLDIRIPPCDTIIYLDFPTGLCLYRVLKRSYIFKKGQRVDMAKGCDERFSLEFIWWVINLRRRIRPKVYKYIKELGKDKNVLIIKSPKELDQYFLNLEKEG